MRFYAALLLCVGCSETAVSTSALSPKIATNANNVFQEPHFIFSAPDGFAWNSENKIWHNSQMRTSISLSHGAGAAFENVANDFDKDAMLADGVELLNKDFREIDGRQTIVVKARKRNAKGLKTSITVAYATKSGCAQLTAIYPSEMDERSVSTIESALLNSNYVEPD